MLFLYVFLGIIAVFLSIILIKTALFKPKKQSVLAPESAEFDQSLAIENLQALIRCKTISNVDPVKEDNREFEKLISMLPGLYPRVFDVCSFNRLPGRALLLRWPGKHDDAPSVMMAHYDVVPADEEKWDYPPFEGIIEEGILWGRGTLDTKVTMNGILCAANHLIGKGFQPENDIYFAFSGGEEVNGQGAANIVDYFATHHIHPALVLDEGGAVVENVFPGVKEPCGLIGIAEKGMLNVQYNVHSAGGHASAPSVRNPIQTLSKACVNVLKRPFRMHLTKPAKEMFDILARRSTFGYRLIFANLWCFGPILDLICRRNGGDLNAVVRTTVAFTQMDGSTARNVMPTEARMISNVRLNPQDTVSSAMTHLKMSVNDPHVKVHMLEGFDPSPISETNCPAWDKISSSVTETWRESVVAPYLMVQCSDSRHYGRISNHVYRFSPMDITAEERKTIHGNNEHIRLESICKAVEFYIRLMRKC